jgi:bifunctional non-homologous end joining protein LigD
VVQKHEATRLHYDFRLESVKEDVLLSWAIPKGPSLDPSIKRLAIQTEDHPVDYLSFEGVIPEGNYGAGTVIVWDIGEYILEKSTLTKYSTRENLEEMPEVLDLSELKKKYGKITFVLYGQKLKGKFSLVKTKTKNQWLLIKLKDDFARSSNSKDKNSEKDITESRPESVLTGKKNKDLMQYKSRKTLKKEMKDDNSTLKYSAQIPDNPNTPDTLGDDNLDTINLSSTNQSLKQIYFEEIKPMLPSLTDKPFNNKDWIFEIKWDGVRAITIVDRLTKTCTIKSRRGDTITQRYPELENAFKSALKEDMFKEFVILDGCLLYTSPSPRDRG